MGIKPLGVRSVLSSVPAHWVGVYYLGFEQNSIPRYVGRSDRSLRYRLLAHARTALYDWFRAIPASTTYHAFRMECQGWHLLRRSGLDNVIHPAAPSLTPVRCPYCDFSDALDHYYQEEK